METNQEIVGDLKSLINILNDGKEGYDSAAETTKSSELKSVFLEQAGKRDSYAQELKAHLARHGGNSDNESGGLLGVLHRTWIDLKEGFSSHDDKAILSSIETGEKAAIEQFDKVLENEGPDSDHIEILQKQRTGIRESLSEIETYRQRLDTAI
ncbi:PA2169 family four-helix-bundle protein [Pedobacter sp. L105]|uniref:ferritin-like domain-containing protein n=1 Tax=Pedobacter sp. L105 TaxID=1641871 RepID=UPI00131DDAA6|nr:PA2169 family four-helix-bundle protein [Pedobacter sp. L105]